MSKSNTALADIRPLHAENRGTSLAANTTRTHVIPAAASRMLLVADEDGSFTLDRALTGDSATNRFPVEADTPIEIDVGGTGIFQYVQGGTAGQYTFQFFGDVAPKTRALGDHISVTINDNDSHDYTIPAAATHCLIHTSHWVRYLFGSTTDLEPDTARGFFVYTGYTVIDCFRGETLKLARNDSSTTPAVAMQFLELRSRPVRRPVGAFTAQFLPDNIVTVTPPQQATRMLLLAEAQDVRYAWGVESNADNIVHLLDAGTGQAQDEIAVTSAVPISLVRHALGGIVNYQFLGP